MTPLIKTGSDESNLVVLKEQRIQDDEQGIAAAAATFTATTVSLDTLYDSFIKIYQCFSLAGNNTLTVSRPTGIQRPNATTTVQVDEILVQGLDGAPKCELGELRAPFFESRCARPEVDCVLKSH